MRDKRPRLTAYGLLSEGHIRGELMPVHNMRNYSAASARGNNFQDAAALLRIRAEFCEMPGLKLTLAQASRLFQLEVGRCQEVLMSMVETGHLILRGDTFLRTPSA